MSKRAKSGVIKKTRGADVRMGKAKLRELKRIEREAYLREGWRQVIN